jgi:hypothetical protein
MKDKEGTTMSDNRREEFLGSLHPFAKKLLVGDLEEMDAVEHASQILQYMNECRMAVSDLQEEWLRGEMLQKTQPDKKRYTYQEYRDDAVKMAKNFEKAYENLESKHLILEAIAAEIYEKADEYEQCAILSNKILDIMIQQASDRKENSGDMNQSYSDENAAYHALYMIWCPKAAETAWDAGDDDPVYYGNELIEDHSGQSINVQTIYEKLKRYLVMKRG